MYIFDIEISWNNVFFHRIDVLWDFFIPFYSVSLLNRSDSKKISNILKGQLPCTNIALERSLQNSIFYSIFQNMASPTCCILARSQEWTWLGVVRELRKDTQRHLPLCPLSTPCPHPRSWWTGLSAVSIRWAPLTASKKLNGIFVHSWTRRWGYYVQKNKKAGFMV